MKQSKIYDYCVYTIVQSEKLGKKLTKGNGSGCFSEKKNWATARKLLNDAHKKSEEMVIVFSKAEDTSDLVYRAKLKDIQVGKDEAGDIVTTYWFTNLVELQPPLLKKKDLVLRSTGQKISKDFIRPYAVCKTPKRILDTVKN